MTFYEPIASLESRAMDMPNMGRMLNALHQKHLRLQKWVTADAVWKMAHVNRDSRHSLEHVSAATLAGFIEQHFNTGKLRLTDKGREAIGVERPFWMGAV